MRSQPRAALFVLVATTAIALLAGCTTAPATPSASPSASLELVQVPGDAATLAEASALVAPGGIIEIGAGVWTEQLLVSTPDVTVRGADRNETIIDGEGLRPYGVVGIADGVRIENLTVTGATFYGVLVTGLHDEAGPAAHGAGAYEPFDPEAFPPLQRFAIEGVTAHNNGLYGIYAFNAQHGVVRESYASGSADSGFYIGQCETCDILVESNVAERNAVGFENANASGLTVVGNRFSDNRVGMTFLSNYVEAFSPQRDNQVAGNLVSNNVSTDSPSQADGGFGIGIGVAGGVDDLFVNNRITGNPRAGVLISNTEDLATIGATLQQTSFADNGVDVANVSAERAPATGTCVDSTFTALPESLLEAANACGDGEDPASTTAELPAVEAPPGVSFLQVAAPIDQPQFTSEAGVLPGEIVMPDATAYPVPTADLFADRIGTR
ncbi:right-handed parallel beta-helix repeat-containing protein (plasmid) [Coraliomargarita sp. W4R53]